MSSTHPNDTHQGGGNPHSHEDVPRVSVVIPTMNRSDYLRQALLSVEALRGPDLDLEVIVADNGSTDDTELVVREFGADYVRVDRPGAAAARNAGMRAATGDYIAFLDDDDVWLTGHLRPHLNLFASQPDVSAVVSQVVSADVDLVTVGDPWPSAAPIDGDYFRAFFTSYPQIGATVIRTGVRDTVGYQDESLFGSEDWDWHLRLALEVKVGFVPTPSVLFRLRPPTVRDDLQWSRLGFWRRVFITNVFRSRGSRVPLRLMIRTYVRQSGWYYNYFLSSFLMHHGLGDDQSARPALKRAILSSPPHAIRDLVTLRAVRWAWRTWFGSVRTSRAAVTHSR